MHTACPNVHETIKWNMPTFIFNGSILCGMAAFKHHCAFGFWKSNLINDSYKVFIDQGIGNFGKITCLENLPKDEILIDYIHQAMKLKKSEVNNPKVKREPKTVIYPEDLILALTHNPNAKKNFEGFSYTNKKEYIDWLMEAKTEKTRKNRLAQAIEWIAEAKSRNWKYLPLKKD